MDPKGITTSQRNNIMLDNQTLPVNSFTKEEVTIQRGRHDRENPYVMISRKMLRDPSISPKAKGVLCFLLSLPDNWKAHPRQLAESLGVSKDQIYTILKELISIGYATRTESKGEHGRFGYVVYEFYEEKLDVPQKIKEKTTVAGFPDTEKPDTEKPPLRNKEDKKEIPEEKKTSLKVPEEPKAAKAAEVEIPKLPKSKREKSEFSPKVREVGTEMINSLTRIKPDYIPPRNIAAFLTEVDFLLRIDQRDPIKILDVFNWALSDPFWMDKMFKPNPAKYVREKFDQFEMKMKTPIFATNKVDRRTKNMDGTPVSAPHLENLF